MSDYSDPEDSDYVTPEKRGEIIRSAMDIAEAYLRLEVDRNNIWKYINDMETPSYSNNPEDNWKGVILALQEFCKDPTNEEYREQLTANIVNNLVSSSLETQYELEEFINGEIFNTRFWTLLIAHLIHCYTVNQEAVMGLNEDSYVSNSVSCPTFRF